MKRVLLVILYVLSVHQGYTQSTPEIQKRIQEKNEETSRIIRSRSNAAVRRTTSTTTQIPNNQDCLGAIPICQNIYSTQVAYYGTGNYQNEINEEISCLRSGERNDVWYIFTVQQAGELSFNITPDNPKDDYDWAVFDLTNANCSDIYSNLSLQKSCNYAPNMGCGGITGPNGNFNQADSCSSQNEEVINVEIGHTYVINVSQFSTSTEGYTIDFSASTAVIFDNVAPLLRNVEIPESPGASSLNFSFSENVLCSTVQASDFILTGPDGVHNITSVSGTECAVGANSGKNFTINFSNPITVDGSYTLGVVGAITDQCSNVPLNNLSFTINCGWMNRPVISVTGSLNACSSNPPTLSAPAGAYTYRWSNGETTQTISPTATNNYSVTITNAAGCSATSLSVPVTVIQSPPVPVINPSGPLTFCTGASVTLSAPQGYSYRWTTGDTTRVITVSQTGNYSVTVRNNLGCSNTSELIAVTVIPYPSKIITANGPLSLCYGESLKLIAPEGSSYLWNTGERTREITVGNSGNISEPVYNTYFVNISNASDCSVTSSPVTVTLYPKLTPAISANGPLTFCSDGSVTLTAPASSQYQWNTGAVSQSIVVNSSGKFAVRVRNASGCWATSDSITVTKLLIAINGQQTICEGEQTTLSASPGFTSYRWFKNGVEITGSEATVSQLQTGEAAFYSVEGITSTGNCRSIAFQLNVSPLLGIVPVLPNAVATSASSYNSCGPVRVSLRTETGKSLTDRISYQVVYDDQATATFTSPVFILEKSGRVNALYEGENGCNKSLSFDVAILSAATLPVITASGPTSFCQGESVMLSAPEGYTYLWSNGETSRSITVTNPGEYTVKVSNGSGCYSTSGIVRVMVNPAKTRYY